MLSIITLIFNLLIWVVFFEYLLINNLEKSLLASKQIIKPINKIDKINDQTELEIVLFGLIFDNFLPPMILPKT